jgi:hypothetical protein
MSDLRKTLEQHRSDYDSRIDSLLLIADRVSPLLQNTLVINGRLNIAGVVGLSMHEAAEVTPLEYVPTPTNQNQVGRFAYGFHMNEGYIQSTDSEKRARIPMGTETLQSIRQQGTHGVDLTHYRDHRSRPAYYRALALFPGFFVNLTVDISAEDEPPAKYGPEIYLAYNIMAKLVDKNDPGVINKDRIIDKAYLFRRTVNLPNRKLASAS